MPSWLRVRLWRAKKRPLYVVKKVCNGKGWIGPYAHNGAGWSEHPRLWYRFKSSEGAAVTLRGCDLAPGHEIHKLI